MNESLPELTVIVGLTSEAAKSRSVSAVPGHVVTNGDANDLRDYAQRQESIGSKVWSKVAACMGAWVPPVDRRRYVQTWCGILEREYKANACVVRMQVQETGGHWRLTSELWTRRSSGHSWELTLVDGGGRGECVTSCGGCLRVHLW